MKLATKVKIIAGLFLLVSGIFVCAAIIRSGASDELVKLESYNDGKGQTAICPSLSPECGYCPGEVRDDSCYVTPNELMQW